MALLVADSMSIAPPGAATSDATHIGPNVFAVVDGVDDVDGSGSEALRDIVRLLGLTRQAPRWDPVLRAANWLLWHHANTDGRAGKRAVTVTAAIWTGYRFVIGHVGDSRAYLVRGGVAHLLTKDHGGRHPNSADPGMHVPDEGVVRLGQSPNGSAPDIVRVTPELGDRLVLCTDGLWRVIPPARMAVIVLADPTDACARLAAYAAARASENASAVVVAVERSPAPLALA